MITCSGTGCSKVQWWLITGVLVILVKGTISDSQEYFKHIQPSASVETQKEAAESVIKRLIPEIADRFVVFINSSLPVNSYQIIKEENSTVVVISGSSGVSVCKGFYHYLKYHLKGHVSWSGNQLRNIHENNEFPSVRIQHTSPSLFTYYQNVCTWSYSFAWWTWKDWRKHIDWMAFMGINLSLAPIQEAIWKKIYQKIGLTDSEIAEHFAGPTFQAWQRMGNIRGWGGSLPEFYMIQQINLQKQIIKAQRDLGMIVALPGFAGHVPVAFKRIFPNASLTPVSRWNRFQNQYCCPLFLDPSDPLFHQIGRIFLTEINHFLGTDHVYFADPFNELQPKSSDANYLRETSFNIYKAMQDVDSKAIWLMQGWMFVKNPFWNDKLLKAFLTAVPLGKLLVLDLQSEQYPQYDRTKSYFGQPFIWNMLHNFGGTLGMHGSLNLVNRRIEEARDMPGSTMVGVGITPEGINQNYPIYEFALERAWNRGEFNKTEWFQYYSVVRYGADDENLKNTWTILMDTVYDYNGLVKLHGKYTICQRPSIKLSPWTWYPPKSVEEAWTSMLNSNKTFHKDALFKHDLVDLTRQFLQLLGDDVYLKLISAYKKKNLTQLIFWSNTMIDVLQDIEKILKTNRHFLLGVWLNSAKDISYPSIFEFNARNQITIWGPNGEIVDYANKQWSGVVEDFFIPRWKLFLKELQNSLQANKTFNERAFKMKVFENVEYPFSTAKKIYPVDPQGSTIDIAWEIHSKWTSFLNGITGNETSSINFSTEVTPSVILS